VFTLLERRNLNYVSHSADEEMLLRNAPGMMLCKRLTLILFYSTFKPAALEKFSLKTNYSEIFFY